MKRNCRGATSPWWSKSSTSAKTPRDLKRRAARCRRLSPRGSATCKDTRYGAKDPSFQIITQTIRHGAFLSTFWRQETAAYKMAALQKALDDSVPLSELEKANQQYTELTVKYRDMLQRDSRLIQRTNNLEHLEVFKRRPSEFLAAASFVDLFLFSCHSE